MIKTRRIYANWSPSDVKFLKKSGVILSSEEGYCSFDIEEGDLYESLKKSFLTKTRDNFSDNQIGTSFTVEEINQSEYFAVFLPTKGYPQPASDGSYRDITFKEYYKSSGIKKNRAT
ncbi:hypothetical protein ACU8V7_01690 [Zobellia nedashkovskayae]